MTGLSSCIRVNSSAGFQAIGSQVMVISFKYVTNEIRAAKTFALCALRHQPTTTLESVHIVVSLGHGIAANKTAMPSSRLICCRCCPKSRGRPKVRQPWHIIAGGIRCPIEGGPKPPQFREPRKNRTKPIRPLLKAEKSQPNR